LGDFKFKKNKTLAPENQIITANPEVTVHDITGQDEFIVIACDGMFHDITLGVLSPT
jgi:protein phosphatase PTC2/3